MTSSITILTALALLVSPALTNNIRMVPKGFVKLPTNRGAYTIASGTANKAAYDHQTNLLYVVGHNADVMNILDMRDSMTEPKLARTIMFDALNQGFPNDVKLCRTTGGLARAFLAISFESKDLTERGHVHFYQPLTDPQEVLVRLKTVTAVEGFDPKSIFWNNECTELLVVSKGQPHTINGAFEDPRPSFDILVPTFGLNVDRRNIPFSEAVLKASNIRQVFSQCDTGTFTGQSDHVQDLEPDFVTVDENDNAYILFQSNNAIGKMDLNDPFSTLMYTDLGFKDWSKLGIDTSYDDGGLKLNSHTMKSFYQPGHAVTFTLSNNHTYIVTADGGSKRTYSYRAGSTTLCSFAESSLGSSWRESFSLSMDGPTITALKANLSSAASLGRMSFSRVRTFMDGYNPLQMGFNHLTTYGGRGWSMMDATSMKRVYESGDLFEAYYTTSAVTDKQKSMFNDYYYNANTPQSRYTDRTSPTFGPMPTAIASGNVNGTQVVAVANGYVGGIYAFGVTLNDTTSEPEVDFLGFGRRGSPGLTWGESYAKDDDSVGEPGITDMLFIQDEGENLIVAISSIAGVASFYAVEVTP